jgi:predicted ATP-grasp superfamily ATP-dependent carboligase
MLCQVWPVAEQRLRRDGFEYLGGQIPAVDIPADLAAQLISRCRVCISGLHGYVGFDFLAPEESPEELLLVEINPRLTTSYVGYREASRDNLAAWIMNPSRQPGPTFSGRVAFAANGDILERDA